MPDRPLTPCEVQTQLRPARTVASPWSANHTGPCEFVDVQVVTDSVGRLEPGSPSLLKTNVPGVATNVVKSMSEGQYRPARVGSRAVRAVRRFHFASPGSPTPC